MRKKKKDCREEKLNLEEAKIKVARLNYLNMPKKRGDRVRYIYCHTCMAYHLRKPKKFKNWL